MNFQISRNGQLYGPYTLEDLKRYLATGNILLSDLAKSEDMPDWRPVGEILSGSSPAQPTAAAAAPAQPEAFPVAFTAPAFHPAQLSPALATSAFPDPPSLHWALVALFSLFTCGLFMLVWNLIVCAWLRRVQPNATALLFYIAEAVCLAIAWINHILHASTYTEFLGAHVHTRTSGLGGLLFLVVLVLRIVARFNERANLEEHFNGPEPLALRLNPVLTFFFGGLFFQHHLTRIAALKQAARFGQPAAFPY